MSDAEQKLKVAEEEAARLKEEVADAKADAESTRGETRLMKRQEREKLNKADAKGFQEAFDRAGKEYKRTA